MSHALLLRLFLSPYFSISVAMHYLKTYPDSIGISHYLCWRMKSMPADEVEFYWPQICHLLLTYPTPSNALESFILSRAEESTHSAMLTFWFMQAALRDLTPTRQTNPRPFLICQRVLHRCHEIIFGDPPEPSRSPYRSLPHSPAASSTGLLSSTAQSLRKIGSSDNSVIRTRVRVKPHVPPSLVGMGTILAAVGMPGLSELAGQWAVIQGQRAADEDSETRARVEVDKAGGADVHVTRQRPTGPSRQHSRNKSAESGSDEEKPSADTPLRPARYEASRMSSVPHPASTAPNLSAPTSTPGWPPRIDSDTPAASPRIKGEDPFSQEPSVIGPSTPPDASPARHSPFASVPELGSSPHARQASALRRLQGGDRPPTPESLLSTYSLDAQRQLLRSHYCRSQVRFLLLLEDISNRLLVIPKLARVSALRAELTSLNHNLPAEVCMPLWCAANHSHEEGGEMNSVSTPFKGRIRGERRKGHSRVVRISPGDSVVLNSAERAPFLLHVELLHGDLDFDPTRRENKELLKKIVSQEDSRKRKKEDVGGLPAYSSRFEGFGSPMPDAPPEPLVDAEAKTPIIPAESRRDAKPEDMEEMDLVEQMYGAKLSVKDVLPDMSDSIPLPNAPKNKAVDALAWDRGDVSRRGSSTPLTTPSAAFPSDGPGTPSGNNLSRAGTPIVDREPSSKPVITLEDYSERMRTAAVMLAQLNASLVSTVPDGQATPSGGALSWIPGTGWITGSRQDGGASTPGGGHSIGEPSTSQGGKLKLAAAQAAAIRDRIMEEMMSLEEERVERMTDRQEGEGVEFGSAGGDGNTAEDEGIVRRELNKADPSAAVFKESWTAKKARIRSSSPWGHLANWDVISVIVKTGTDLRQEQLATQLIERFGRIFKEEKSECWVRFFRILITGEQSGLVETITDAVSVHSIKKGEYARRIAEGGPIGKVSLMDHFVNTYGKPDSGRFARAQRNFIKSLAGYSIVTYLLQIKDRHNGNILVDRDGHVIHIDFGFMLSNSPGGNMGFEAAPFKMPLEYIDIMGGLDSPGYAYFKKLFKEGFEAARKHSDSLLTIVELMQKDSKLDCFALFGQQTTQHFRERFALGLTTSAVDAYLERLIVSSTGSNYTRLYDTFQYYSQGVL